MSSRLLFENLPWDDIKQQLSNWILNWIQTMRKTLSIPFEIEFQLNNSKTNMMRIWIIDNFAAHLAWNCSLEFILMRNSQQMKSLKKQIHWNALNRFHLYWIESADKYCNISIKIEMRPLMY